MKERPKKGAAEQGGEERKKNVEERKGREDMGKLQDMFKEKRENRNATRKEKKKRKSVKDKKMRKIQ